MKELATKFIGQTCTVYSFDSSKTYKGVIKEVTDGAILLQKDNKTEVLNMDFISRIKIVEKKG